MRIAALVAAVTSLVACNPSDTKLEQQPASSTSFMAVVVSGSRTKLYMQSTNNLAGEYRLAVVDAGAPAGTDGLISFIDLGGGAIPRAVGSSGKDVVVLDRNNPAIHFIDGATDTVRGSATFPPEAQVLLSSNPGYYSAAVAVDAASRKAYVATSLGILQYDLDTMALTATLDAPPTESFALDAAAGRIYAPFYLCNPNPDDPTGCYPFPQPGGPDLTDSVSVIDIAARKTYALVDPAAADVHAPLGFEPDATAVDLSLGLLAVATEDPSAVWVMELAAATYDATALTCRMHGLEIPMPGLAYTMMAVDVATQLLVVGQEDANGMAFIDMVQAKAGHVSKLEVTMPDLPNGDAWFSKGDPHSVTIGVVDGRSYAFVGANTLQWIARIDLAGVAEVMAGRGTFASHVSYISFPPPP